MSKLKNFDRTGSPNLVRTPLMDETSWSAQRHSMPYEGQGEPGGRIILFSTLRATRCIPESGNHPEAKRDPETVTAELKDWVRRYAEDRARRGIPSKGAPL